MLQLRNISKAFAKKQVLQDISFDVHDGEVVALLGPSGSGKSTLLSIIAGLEKQDSGQVLWDGADLMETPTYRRGFGLMFQDFALFPHRDVVRNVAFGLEMAGESKEAITEKTKSALSLVGLAGFEHHEVTSLSGGEQQRVALARALAPQPRLLMLDEPLGSLDRALRTHLLDDLTKILRTGNQSSLYVTHDQEEAYAIADRIVILNAGLVAQIGTPEDIYLRPASAFVARFLGFQNLFPARLTIESGNKILETPFGKIPAPAAEFSGNVVVLFRSESVTLGGEGPLAWKGKIQGKQFRGSQIQIEVAIDQADTLVLETPSDMNLPPIGAAISISFDPAKAVQVFPHE